MMRLGGCEGIARGRAVCHMQGHLKDTRVAEIRNSFWEVFPDSLLYAGVGRF